MPPPPRLCARRVKRESMLANGVISEPYVHGVVHCAGNPVYGHPCVSPILDITNGTDDVMDVRYASRASGLNFSESNRVILQPNGGKALLTGMLPGNSGGLGGQISYLAVSLGLLGPFDVYALVFSAGLGFHLVSAPGKFQEAPDGSIVQVSVDPATCATPTAGVFPLQYKGCAAPNWWPWNLVFTVSFGKKCTNKNAQAPCAALSEWALATTVPPAP